MTRTEARPGVGRPFYRGVGFTLALGLAGALLLILFWRYLIMAGLAVAAFKYVAKRAGYRPRRRPKASWAKLLESLSLVMVAWNTRGLVQKVPTGRRGFSLGLGRPLRRAAVPERDDTDGIPF